MSQRETAGGQARTTRRSDETEVDDEVATESGDLAERQEKLSSDVDDLLDEIDDVLEENSEEFVKGFVQKGGQ